MTRARDPRTGPREPGVDDSPRYRVMRLATRAVVHSVFRVRVTGLEHWPAAPFCLASNHHNGWDPLIIIAVTPATPRITWFGPREADFSRGFKNRVMAFFGGAIPFHPAMTTLTSAARAVRRVFDSGGVLGIFAEGRNGYRETEILPFEDGAVAFATMAGVPIVPCVISGTIHLWLGKRLTVSFGAPIPTAGVRGGAGRAQLTDAVRSAMEGMLPPVEPSAPSRRPLRSLLTDLLNGREDVQRRIETLGE